MIQTANGALNQISSLLQTMDSLAINSSNGATNSTQSLSANQQEFAALQNQIDQIAKTTSFGSTALLDGSFSGQVLQVGAFDNTNQQLTITIQAATSASLEVSLRPRSRWVAPCRLERAAISAVQSAINTVASIEANVGSVQDQLSGRRGQPHRWPAEPPVRLQRPG